MKTKIRINKIRTKIKTWNQLMVKIMAQLLERFQ